METDFEKIKKEIQERLSERRYEHSLGVVEAIEELAEKYGGDKQKARLVALTHDIAKEIGEEERNKYIEKYNIEVSEEELADSGLLHGKLGAYIVKEKYGFDEEMQEAIKAHTKGSLNMSKLGKMLYIADTVENRIHKLEDVQETVKQCETLDEAYHICMAKKITYTLRKKNLKENIEIYLEEMKDEADKAMKLLKQYL